MLVAADLSANDAAIHRDRILTICAICDRKFFATAALEGICSGEGKSEGDSARAIRIGKRFEMQDTQGTPGLAPRRAHTLFAHPALSASANLSGVGTGTTTHASAFVLKWF
jgi:hypothetical protein